MRSINLIFCRRLTNNPRIGRRKVRSSLTWDLWCIGCAGPSSSCPPPPPPTPSWTLRCSRARRASSPCCACWARPPRCARSSEVSHCTSLSPPNRPSCRSWKNPELLSWKTLKMYRSVAWEQQSVCPLFSNWPQISVHLDPLEEKHTRGGGGGGERVDGGGGGVPALARPPCVFVFL